MKLFFSSSDEGGCAYYRSYLPSKHLKSHYETTFSSGFPQNNPPEVQEADVIILQRHSARVFIRWIPEWRSQGKKVIYDIDDDFWNIPKYNPNKDMYNKLTKMAIEVIMMMCDAVICSTDVLAKQVSKFNKNVYVTPNLVEIFYPGARRVNKKIRIGWGGSKSHVGDWPSNLTQVLKHCQQKYDIEMIWLGHRLAEIPGDRLIETTPMPKYLDVLNRANLDIALAPLDDNKFNNAKSNLKFLEYSACSYPSILSGSDAYKNTVWHGETGFIAKGKYWEEWLEHLCENEAERKRVGEAAFKFVENNFSWWENKEKHLSVYRDILGG